MSDSRPEQDRLETTVTPVRRREPSGDAFESMAEPRRGRAALIGAAAVLLAAAIVVFVYLPNRVAEDAAEEQAVALPETPVAEAAPPPQSREEREALRQQAEELLAQLLEQRLELDGRSAASWGAADWESYEAAARRADDALLAGEVVEAVADYELALATGETLFRRSEEIMTNALAAGEEAITAGNPELAGNQFALVLTVDPDHQRALAGQARAEMLPAVLDAMRRGDALVLAGDDEAAAEAYREALAIDSGWGAARSALQSVTARIAESRFDSLITEGFTALDAERFDRAAEVFGEALAMRPGSVVARDGLDQAEQGSLMNAIVMAEVRGMAFERRELWNEAIARYREALATDPALTFAIEGLERAQRRADLEAKIEAMIETPERLLSEEGLADAKLVLEEASAIEDPGPTHTELAGKLAGLIEVASAPVSVTLVSDNATEVTVYRIGDLGTFTTHELTLRPGQYTAVGARRGYRDVRETFTVLPGRENGPVTVICVEEIFAGQDTRGRAGE
jgi:tetratricopeptide (TPR) repeat protein